MIKMNKQSSTKSNQEQTHVKYKLNNDVLQKIFTMANNKCHTCNLRMTTNNLKLFMKHNKHYYCSKACFTHI